jgi:hypothetical protein
VAAFVAVLTLGTALSACSTSPPAASVNGEVITEAQLAQNLTGWARSPAYVTAFNEASKQQAAQYAAQGQQVPAFTVEGTGSGPGNFGLEWTTGRLTALVSALAVQQYLQHRGASPSGLQRAAAFSSEQAADPQVWPQLTQQLRSEVTHAAADLALVQTGTTDLKTAESFFKAHASYFWSQVCLTTVDVSVPGPNGTTDMTASRKQAEAVAAQLSGAPGTATQTPVTGGARYCLVPAQLIQQPPAFAQEVNALQPGGAGIIPASYGYQVVQVRSRTAIPFDEPVAAVIDVVALGAGISATSWPVQGDANDTGLTRILKAAKVDVNPSYGTWTTALPAPPYIPQVWPAGQSSP